MHFLLAQASDKLTQQMLLERWPAEADAPDRSTLSRWLKRATRQGLVCCSGSGYRGDPLRYWLPGREPLLWPGDTASEAEKQAWRDRCAEHYRSLRRQTTSTSLAAAAAEDRSSGVPTAGACLLPHGQVANKGPLCKRAHARTKPSASQPALRTGCSWNAPEAHPRCAGSQAWAIQRLI
jgi:hypothetical protein